MNDNHDPTGNSEFICEFGSVRLDKPFSEQPDVQKFLDVPFAQEGRLVSDEFLFRLLAIAECVIKKDLDATDSDYQLFNLYLGYEVRMTSADLQDGQPEVLEQSAWVSTKDDAEDETRIPESSKDNFIASATKPLIKQCQDEIIQRINSTDPNVLSEKILYIFLRGELDFRDGTSGFAPPPTLSAHTCKVPGCDPGKTKNINTQLCTEPC